MDPLGPWRAGLAFWTMMAEAQAVVAAETIGKAETQTLGDYRMMPRATFCSPQVASFGLTEEQAKAEGHEVKVAKFPFSANGKANGLGEPVGFVKLIADAEPEAVRNDPRVIDAYLGAHHDTDLGSTDTGHVEAIKELIDDEQ